MQTIAVIDYGMGNLRSVARALEHVAASERVLITADPEQVASADRVVFPGQGAMPDCMANLSKSGLADAVREAARLRPFLGVCVGEHMLLQHSEETNNDQPTEGLGIIEGSVKRLAAAGPEGVRLKVPHMGWNQVQQRTDHPLWAGVPDNAYFYFVHSYYAQVSNSADIAGDTEYGVRFTSALARDNIFATQFHPEKSAGFGLKIYDNFVKWNP